MLFYHPAFDVYHAVFRLLVLLDSVGKNWIELDRLRIYDFFLLFPHELSLVRMSPLMKSVKRDLARLPQHESIGNPARVFYQLEPLFNHAVEFLTMNRLIDREDVDMPRVRLLTTEFPVELRQSVKTREAESSLPIATLLGELSTYQLHGPDGLKARTNLLPFRYDRR